MDHFRAILMWVCFVGIAAMLIDWLAVTLKHVVVDAVSFVRRRPLVLLLAPLTVSLFLHGSEKPTAPSIPTVKLNEVSANAGGMTFRLEVPAAKASASATVQTRKVFGSAWTDSSDITLSGTNATYTVTGDFVGGKEDRKVRVMVK